MIKIRPKFSAVFTSLSVSLLFSACATPSNHYDPLEPINRVSFRFNEKVDRYALKPVARAYVHYVPGPARDGISNFTANIGGISSTAGNLMEGDIKNTFQDIGRIVINTVFGLFGLVDWATDLGLPAQNRSIGKALGRWGVGTGPYLILPIFGSTTLRDGTDILFEWRVNVPHRFSERHRYMYAGIDGIDTRASYLPYEATLDDQLIFDRYSYIRDSYLQKRYNDVYYGLPPKPFVLGEPVDEESLKEDDRKSNQEPDVPATREAPAK